MASLRFVTAAAPRLLSSTYFSVVVMPRPASAAIKVLTACWINCRPALPYLRVKAFWLASAVADLSGVGVTTVQNWDCHPWNTFDALWKNQTDKTGPPSANSSSPNCPVIGSRSEAQDQRLGILLAAIEFSMSIEARRYKPELFYPRAMLKWNCKNTRKPGANLIRQFRRGINGRIRPN